MAGGDIGLSVYAAVLNRRFSLEAGAPFDAPCRPLFELSHSWNMGGRPGIVATDTVSITAAIATFSYTLSSSIARGILTGIHASLLHCDHCHDTWLTSPISIHETTLRPLLIPKGA